MRLFCIIARFWCGRKERSDGIARNERPGIEDVRRYEKSLYFQGFFAIERQHGGQNFFWEGMILLVLFNSKNKPNMERIVFLWYFTYLVNIVP